VGLIKNKNKENAIERQAEARKEKCLYIQLEIT